MDRETFFQRLGALLQKSRKAQRLYSNMGRASSDVSPYSETQIEEWRSISAEIVRQLSQLLDRPNNRNLVNEVVVIRDNFYQLWRSSEGALHKVQRNLINVAEKGDFIRAVTLADEAVGLKARVQAAHAAHHEFSEILKSTRSADAVPEINDSQVVALEREYQLEDISSLNRVLEQRERRSQRSQEDAQPIMAKVIPLRRA